MSGWQAEMVEALAAFRTVAELAGELVAPDEIAVEYLPAPHRPPVRLPGGTMAVYAFHDGAGWLKIGRVGPASAARYTSQHYNPDSSRSNLARSLRADPALSSVPEFSFAAPGDWIKAHTHRVNILLLSSRSGDLLVLLEAFLHARLRPRYEG